MVATHPMLAELLGDDHGTIVSVLPLPGGRNELYRVSTSSGQHLVVKLYREAGGSVANREIEMLARLDGCPAVPSRLAHAPPSGDRPGYLVKEYAEGVTLRHALGNVSPRRMHEITAQLLSFLECCFELPATGYGDLDDDLHGQESSWSKFLVAHFERAEQRIDALPADIAPALRESHNALHAALQAEDPNFDSVLPALVPVDLNLDNLLVTANGHLVVLDLEAFWSADRLLALGEWAAHTWGTPMYSGLASAWGSLSPAEHRRLHIYALMATLDIQLFVADRDPTTTREARPWGNPIAFEALAESHRAALLQPRVPIPTALLEANPSLGDDWGIKLAEGLGQRTVPVADTLRRLQAIRTLAGVTRLADVTDLDDAGIPVFQATRPDAESAAETFTVFTGKGVSAEECKSAAIAESVERFCAERRNYDDERVVHGSLTKLWHSSHSVVDPRAFNLPADAPFDEETSLEWIPTRNLCDGTSHLVPASAVFYPYAGTSPLRHFTTGLAAGNTILEATTYGLAEVVERDAAALNLILRNRPAVSLNTIDSPRAQAYIGQLDACGVHPIVRAISAPDIGIPTFSVILDDVQLRDPMYVSGGYAAHPDKEVALLRALMEAAASRIGTISGAREDLTKYDAKNRLSYSALRQRFAYWFDETTQTVDYRDLWSYRFPTVLEDLAALVTAIVHGAGFRRLLVADLSHPELELPVIKVLVPGIERYSLRMRCVGRRARQAYRALNDRELPVDALQETRKREEQGDDRRSPLAFDQINLIKLD